MSFLDKKTRGDAFRLVIFIVVTTLATGVLVVLIGNITFQSSRTYKAEFSDATGVVKGDDIRIAGVKVGSVKNVEIVKRTHALVTFSVAKRATVTKSSTATIRYRNLVGQRYLSLTQGVGDTSLLTEDSTIPMARTFPALDLTVLFNGFKPLFAALTPADINKLSFEIVKVFQGEGDNIEGLLGNTASITQTLASRDKVIGELIDNLNDVLATVASRDKELTSLIIQLKRFVSGLKDDRGAILGSLDSISNLAEQTADLTTGIRPSFAEGRQAAAPGDQEPRRRPWRGRPRAADPAGQAQQDRTHRDLRLVLQLLPLHLQGPDRAARRQPRDGRRQHHQRRREV